MHHGTCVYDCVIEGYGADGQTWAITETLKTDEIGQFMSLPPVLMRRAFHKLTNGTAIFGQPGVGCKGPYTVTRMLIEQVLSEDQPGKAS
jgi:hypothetical protein